MADRPSDIFHFDFESDDIKEFFDESPDRGIAISLPAILDNRLVSILKAAMRPDDVMLNLMFQPSGPLGSFKAKINVAYMFGFIPEDFFRDLLTILRIRNHFAHKLEAKRLEQPPVKDWIKNMGVYVTMIGIRDRVVAPQDADPVKFAKALMTVETETMRDSFRTCIRFMILRLNEIELHVRATLKPKNAPQ